MKNPLRNLFQGVATRFFVSQEPVFAIENRVQDAGAHFQTAKYGVSCASRAFLTVQDHVEWHAGHQNDDGRWSIRKFTEMPNIKGGAVPVGEMVQKTVTVKAGLSFFDAIVALSVYERGQMELGVLPVDLDAPTLRSEQRHYTDFAEREGIVFDTSGTPHPTVNGEVIGDGVFTKAALMRARAVQKEQSSFYLQGGNQFFEAMVAPADGLDDRFFGVINAAFQESYLQDILMNFRRMDGIIDGCFFTPQLKKRAYSNMMVMNKEEVQALIPNIMRTRESDEDREDRYAAHAGINNITYGMEDDDETIPMAFHRFVSVIHETLPKIEMDPASLQKIALVADTIAFYFDLNAARLATETAQYPTSGKREAYSAMGQSVADLEARFKAFGGDDADLWKIKSALIDQDHIMVKPKIIGDMIVKLDALHKQSEAEQKKAEKQAIAGPHIPSGTASRGPG